MTVRVYNTRTHAKEPFAPRHGKRVSIFVCGITPYDAPHLGHAKTYVAFDVVARWLRHRGYRVLYLQNVTDLDDHIVDRSHESGEAWDRIVDRFFGEYLAGMRALNVTSVNVYAYATDYVGEILEQIRGLVAKGFAYGVEGGDVYYDTTKFPHWGEMSGQKVEEHLAGARVEVDPRKRHPADFVLWKAQKPGEPAWDSPWGPGRPGWHIEDTAIAIAHFGPQYDVHGAASELMFPHHEAEIAQAEAFTGKRPYVAVWMHGGLLNVKGEKMSKSLGNFWTLQDALAAYDPMVLRFFLLNAHYRSPIDFDRAALDEAKAAYARLDESRRNLEAARGAAKDHGRADRDLTKAIDAARMRFEDAMDDDFNTREALAALFDLTRDINKSLASGVGRSALDGAAEVFATAREVLGLFLVEPVPSVDVGPLVQLLIDLREAARQRKDFATADTIRARLGALGIVLEDTKEGVRWKRG